MMAANTINPSSQSQQINCSLLNNINIYQYKYLWQVVLHSNKTFYLKVDFLRSNESAQCQILVGKYNVWELYLALQNNIFGTYTSIIRVKILRDYIKQLNFTFRIRVMIVIAWQIPSIVFNGKIWVELGHQLSHMYRTDIVFTNTVK